MGFIRRAPWWPSLESGAGTSAPGTPLDLRVLGRLATRSSDRAEDASPHLVPSRAGPLWPGGRLGAPGGETAFPTPRWLEGPLPTEDRPSGLDSAVGVCGAFRGAAHRDCFGGPEPPPRPPRCGGGISRLRQLRRSDDRDGDVAGSALGRGRRTLRSRRLEGRRWRARALRRASSPPHDRPASSRPGRGREGRSQSVGWNRGLRELDCGASDPSSNEADRSDLTFVARGRFAGIQTGNGSIPLRRGAGGPSGSPRDIRRQPRE